jgi:spermidine synthase
MVYREVRLAEQFAYQRDCSQCDSALFRMMRLRVQIIVLYLLFSLSGGAALGYQMVWAKMFATGLGHEMPAVLAVVCAFMGGMALGAWRLDRVIARSTRPGRWYGWLEIVIGLWALLSALVIPLTNQSALHLTGLEPSAARHWSICFVLPWLTLLPATAAMGATLPAMERFVAPLKADGRCVGAIYAANTLGAVAGILTSTFLIMPALGFRLTIFVLAVINMLCGVAALWLERFTPEPERDSNDRRSQGARNAAHAAAGAPHSTAPRPLGSRSFRAPAFDANPLSKGRAFVTVLVIGLLGIGYEVVGVRVLSQVLENTIYTFASVLSVFLLGTSMGAALYQRFGRRANSRLTLADLLTAVALTCLVGIFALWKVQSLYERGRAAFGDSKLGVLGAETAVAAAVFLLPTIFMGAMFSHLVQAARRKDAGVGAAAALNTLGGAAAPALFGVVLLPLIGSKWTLVLIMLSYLLLVPKIVGWRWGLLAAPIALTFVLPPNLHIVQVPRGGKLVEYREGVMAAVAVVEDATGHRVLRVNNRFQMGGTAAAHAEYRHAHIPLLLHPAPKRALFLGLGTGITFGAAALHPNLQADGAELIPEVCEVMPQFEPYNFAPRQQKRLKLVTADARRFVRVTDTRYDVIVADLFHPARDGEGFLYTREHFRAIRQRLEAGGLFCQWLPLHQLDEAMLRVIVRTFLDVFPQAQAWLLQFNVDTPVLGLIGALEPIRYSSEWVEKRLDDPQLQEQLRKLSLADSVRLFGNLVAGPETLRDFADDAPLNTDDQPRVTFGAPRLTYQKGATSYGRLLALLILGTPNSREVLQLGAGVEANRFTDRLTKFILARDVYLKGLVAEAEGQQTKAIDAFVESARLSEDFTAGYAQCLTLASLQAKSEPTKARALLERLVAAQPLRPVAGDMLKRLFSDQGTKAP